MEPEVRSDPMPLDSYPQTPPLMEENHDSPKQTMQELAKKQLTPPPSNLSPAKPKDLKITKTRKESESTVFSFENEHPLAPTKELHGQEKLKTINRVLKELQKEPTEKTQTFTIQGKEKTFYVPKVTPLELLQFGQFYQQNSYTGVGICQDTVQETRGLVYTTICLIKPLEQVDFECKQWKHNPDLLPDEGRDRRVKIYKKIIDDHHKYSLPIIGEIHMKRSFPHKERMQMPYKHLIAKQKSLLEAIKVDLNELCYQWGYDSFIIAASPGEPQFPDEQFSFPIEKSIKGHRIFLIHKECKPKKDVSSIEECSEEKEKIKDS